MRQIDEVHDAEHQRQPRRQQKQQQAELQAVQELFDDKQHGLGRFPAKARTLQRIRALTWFETRGVAALLTMRV